jgi:hypothetical protein
MKPITDSSRLKRVCLSPQKELCRDLPWAPLGTPPFLFNTHSPKENLTISGTRMTISE